ncbi:Uncharacterized protein TCM_013984 [Theobroma cacao]|uniref:SWIM-type domain-containing protein n=1 Tax=Theobroma cacao TaxID=3641 RepID=A0A061FY85_THECC|nr:Uncharacterized protein TCM_013984 [Theobroma cacao]
MTSRDPRVEKGKKAAFKEEEEIQVLIDNLMQRTFDLEAAILSNEKIIAEIEFKVNDTYKGGETRVRGVGRDLSFSGLVKLVEEVVGVNSHNEIELHTLLSHAVGVSRTVIKDDEDVASILRDERAVVVFMTVKAGNANNILHEHANDTMMVVSDDDASDQIEDDVEKDDTVDRNHELRYDCEDDYVGGHEDRLEDDRVEQTDIPDCNHADGGRGHTTTIVLEEVELDDHCRTVELEDVEGDPIYENAIALENDIRSLDDSDEERVGCKDKACKFALRATKLLEGEYWQVRMLHKGARKLCNLIETKGNNGRDESQVGIAMPVCAVMWPVVAIDATHLKGRFKGILFVAICKDANEQIYPLAIGIGHVEDEESWSWFLNQLRFEKVYKDAHHDLCNYHLGKNVKNRFKREDVATIFTMVANCYRVIDFDRHMNQLKQLCKPAYDILIRLGPERWALAPSPVRRYKLMTSNTTECINSCLRHTRKRPIMVLIERLNEASHFFVQAIDRVEFQVIGGSKDRVMNLSTKECSCGEFQFNLLLCTHAMAAIRLDLGLRDMRFPFTRLGIPVSGTSPMTCNKLSFCHQVGEVKREELGEKGFHQLGKATDDVYVHNARAMVIIDKIAGVCLHLYRQMGKHHLLSRRLEDVDPRHVQFADNPGTVEIAIQCGL